MASIPLGPITVSLAGDAPYPIMIYDLGLRLDPGKSVDMGKIYTQGQILDSNELRRQIDAGAITIENTGTPPQAFYVYGTPILISASGAKFILAVDEDGALTTTPLV